jgi:hypothetical protein
MATPTLTCRCQAGASATPARQRNQLWTARRVRQPDLHAHRAHDDPVLVSLLLLLLLLLLLALCYQALHLFFGHLLQPLAHHLILVLLQLRHVCHFLQRMRTRGCFGDVPALASRFIFMDTRDSRLTERRCLAVTVCCRSTGLAASA